MTAETLFYIIIGIVVLDFVIDQILDYLNALHFSDPVPPELSDVYDQEEYLRSQQYKKVRYRFSVISALFSLSVMLLFFFLDGFAWVDRLARSISDNEIGIGLLFFGIIMIGNQLLSIPFDYYETFVIETRFGFNKSTKKTFFTDLIKSLLLEIVIGGVILGLIIWFYQKTGSNFWLYTWLLITVFTVFFTLFYSSLIVPFFNIQTPLEAGPLRTAIEDFSKKVGFKLDNIYVIDGSKRSTKANAYFSGFGPKKRIVLYDTLIKDLNIDEIVAVLAHEIGHYRKKHVVYNMLASVLITGITLFILSKFIDNPLLSQALGVEKPSFHVGLVAFGILYSPLSKLTGLLMNLLSRKFEFQADSFAANSFNPGALISGLKKLSAKSLSNLTPHRATVIAYYSHPPLAERVQHLSYFQNN